MDTAVDAFWATLASSLGLSARDIAEIGGFSERFARDLLAGRRPFPRDVQQALELLDDDVDVMTSSLVADVEEGDGVLFVFRTNEDLRARFPRWPGRGKAAGGFIGPHRTAVLASWEIAREQGIDVGIAFFDPP